MHRKNKKSIENSIVFASLPDIVVKTKELYQKVKNQYGLSSAELLTHLEGEIFIPSCIFNTKLSALESIVKYLRENLGMPNREIALLISKSQKSVWQSYNAQCADKTRRAHW